MKRAAAVPLRAAPPQPADEHPPLPPEMLQELARALAELVLEDMRRHPRRP